MPSKEKELMSWSISWRKSTIIAIIRELEDSSMQAITQDRLTGRHQQKMDK